MLMVLITIILYTCTLLVHVYYNLFQGRHQQVISGIEIAGIWNLWNWNWNWNLRNWNWNWNWNLLWVVELELELELKITELELELNWKNGIDPNPGTTYSALPNKHTPQNNSNEIPTQHTPSNKSTHLPLSVEVCIIFAWHNHRNSIPYHGLWGWYKFNNQ